jgi:GTPase SAR1 family protein
LIFFISDLKEERKVSYQEGKEFTTKNGMQFLETSALTGYNIKEAFELMAKEIITKISPIKE